ncbi:hypothetical protein M513_01677 [Trichuris suis]|uniref:SMB domain-containing protein n=1 Tax=Trichuris suis TaxID=68888 RepID=A0A085MK28_9BILA|nr:hypothetical protein M513_01677 [Trichuris suis]
MRLRQLLLVLFLSLAIRPCRGGCAEFRICCRGRNTTCVAYDNILINVLPNGQAAGQTGKDQYVIVGLKNGAKTQLPSYEISVKTVKRQTGQEISFGSGSGFVPFTGGVFQVSLNENENDEHLQHLYEEEEPTELTTDQPKLYDEDNVQEGQSTPQALDMTTSNEPPASLWPSVMQRSNLCYCDEACVRLKDCCSDYISVCPVVDCQVSAWSHWSPCQSGSNHKSNALAEPHCGLGTSVRHREVVKAPQHGGASCPVLDQQRACYEDTAEHCHKTLSEIALILPYKYSSARSLSKKSKIYYDLPKVLFKLKAAKSYCVIFEITWTSRHCSNQNDVLTEGQTVCVQCDPRTQISQAEGRCIGHGVDEKKSRWNLLFTKHCYGQWTRVSRSDGCQCDHAYPDLPRYTFV